MVCLLFVLLATLLSLVFGGRDLNALSPNGIVANGLRNGINNRLQELGLPTWLGALDRVNYDGLHFSGVDTNGQIVSGVLFTNISASGVQPPMNEDVVGLPLVVSMGFTLQSLSTKLANATLADPNLASLMPYLVRCSLSPTDTWTVVYNGTSNTYTGELGLAPSLGQVPLTDKSAELVSSCLMAFVNYFGNHVYISIRNYPSIAAKLDEMNDGAIYEGAFFGNIFNNNTQFTCTGLREDLAIQQSSDRALRVCTEDMKCYFHNVGNCEDVCVLLTENYGYSACRGSDGRLYPAANVFLRSTTPVVEAPSLGN